MISFLTLNIDLALCNDYVTRLYTNQYINIISYFQPKSCRILRGRCCVYYAAESQTAEGAGSGFVFSRKTWQQQPVLLLMFVCQ